MGFSSSLPRPRLYAGPHWTSGHIAAVVNPPGNEKARYQVTKGCPEDPQEWLRRAETCHRVLVA